MIWHTHKFIQLNMGEMNRAFQPRFLGNFSKQILTVVGANGDKIRAGL